MNSVVWSNIIIFTNMLVFSPQKQSFKTVIFQQTKSSIKEQQECTSSDKTLKRTKMKGDCKVG